jgi:hypothetical protein
MSTTSLVPVGDGDDFSLTPYERARASRAQRRAELEIYRHGLAAGVRAECEIQDAQAVADVIQCALQQELDVLDWGLHRADGSAAKAELVARKLNALSSINDRRIARRFGG